MKQKEYRKLIDDLSSELNRLRFEDAIYETGYNFGYYGFGYLSPYYTKEELKLWTDGFMEGKKQLQTWKDERNCNQNISNPAIIED